MYFLEYLRGSLIRCRMRIDDKVIDDLVGTLFALKVDSYNYRDKLNDLNLESALSSFEPMIFQKIRAGIGSIHNSQQKI